MDGARIDALMRKDPHVAPLFEGVFAADTLPKGLHKRPALLVANTDPASQPGAHWVAFYIDKHHHGEYFDSYGLPPIVREHRQFLDRVCKRWTYNHKSLQAIDSTVCGEYCVMYLIHKAHGYTLHQFVNRHFTSDAEKNDRLVHAMFKRTYKNACVMTGGQKCCERKR